MKLSSEQAYAAMFAFLAHWYEMTQSDDIGGLLGSMSLLVDGNTADPAIKGDWEDAVRKALDGSVDLLLRLGEPDSQSE
ncbi:MAG: hypothetical protein AAGM36_11180 [Cyanobacteria bacterium J06597_1]